jgi:chromosome segregation ATPase
MRQDEASKIDNIWAELKQISDALQTIANSAEIKSILQDGCVNKVDARVKSIDEKLNTIVSSIAILKGTLNGSATQNTEHVWEYLKVMTDKMDKLDCLSSIIKEIEILRGEITGLEKEISLNHTRLSKYAKEFNISIGDKKRFWTKALQWLEKYGPVIGVALAALATGIMAYKK